MKKKKEVKTTPSGITYTKETGEFTPEDGFVSEKELRPLKMRKTSESTKIHMGTAKHVTYTTSDPRITRPFVYGFAAIFFLIGLGATIGGLWFFGIAFMAAGVLVFIDGKRDIDKIAEEMKKQGKDVTIDSPEEAKQIKDELKKEVKDTFGTLAKEALTKENHKQISKKAVPLFVGIFVVIGILLSAFVSLPLGILATVVLVGTFLLFDFIISLICRF